MKSCSYSLGFKYSLILNPIHSVIFFCLFLNFSFYSNAQGSAFQKAIYDYANSSFLGSNIDYKLTSDSFIDFTATSYDFNSQTYTSFITKFDTLGIQQWCKKYTSPDPTGLKIETIRPLNDGGTLCLTNHLVDYIFKINSCGDIVWSKEFTSFSSQNAKFILEGADNSLYLMGDGCDLGAVFVMKLDENGNVIWYKTYYNENFGAGSGLLALSNGNILGYGRAGYGLSYFEIDSAGTLLRARKYEDTDPANQNASFGKIAHAIEHPNGEIFISGHMEDSLYHWRAFIGKIDNQFNAEFQKIYFDDYPNTAGQQRKGGQLVFDSDQNIIQVGGNNNSNNLGMLYFIKYDQQLNILNHKLNPMYHPHFKTELIKDDNGMLHHFGGSFSLHKTVWIKTNEQLNHECHDTLASISKIPLILDVDSSFHTYILPKSLSNAIIYSEPYELFENPLCGNAALSNLKPVIEPTDNCFTYGDTLFLNNYNGNILAWEESIDNGVSWNPTFTSNNWFLPSGVSPSKIRVVLNTSHGVCGYDTVNFNIPFDNFLLGVDAGTDNTIFNNDSLQLNGIGGNTFNWNPNINISDPFLSNPTVWPNTTTMYYLESTDGSCTGLDSVLITVIDNSNISQYPIYDLNIPHLISPNHGNWNINGIENYSQNQLTLYNVNGQIVYSAKPYMNDLNSDMLQTGPYFYLIDLNEEHQSIRGKVIVIK